MSKVAKLVGYSFLVRVIVEEGATDAQIIEATRPKAMTIVNESLGENLEFIDDDSECPYLEGEDE